MKFQVVVSEAMKKDVVTVDSEDGVEKAAKTMKEHGVGSVMVTKGGNYTGIITAMDIVYKHVAEKRGEKCRDIMTDELITISPNKSIEEAARKMTEHNIEKLPVIDRGRLVGIITNNDILRIEPALFEILIEKLRIEGSADED